MPGHIRGTQQINLANMLILMDFSRLRSAIPLIFRNSPNENDNPGHQSHSIFSHLHRLSHLGSYPMSRTTDFQTNLALQKHREQLAEAKHKRRKKLAAEARAGKRWLREQNCTMKGGGI